MENISSFFKRIGLEPRTEIEKSVDFLGVVQSNCVTHIAYENLDILEAKPLDLSPEALVDKIVIRGRGRLLL